MFALCGMLTGTLQVCDTSSSIDLSEISIQKCNRESTIAESSFLREERFSGTDCARRMSTLLCKMSRSKKNEKIYSEITIDVAKKNASSLKRQRKGKNHK